MSASSTRRSLDTAARRATRLGVRGTSPTNARSDDHASPRRAVNSPTNSSVIDSTASSSDRSGRRPPLVSVTTERIRWRARSISWLRSGRRTVSSSRWRARACGATTTRAPLRWARQHRSTSSPWNEMALSKPPRARNRSARTSMQADGRTNTSRTASCCSWSNSPGSVIGSTSPKRSRPRPTCWRTARSSHDTSFGPTRPAFERYSSSTIARTASGSRATSSWQMQKNPLSPSTSASTSLAATPKPGLASSGRTNASGRYSVIRAARSLPSASTGSPASRKRVLRLG